ncbi:MAG: tRNA pseudouridine(55) synthase TruB [Gammaproteobacteria bacterium]|nr:tRNA pseudouridine(55) synthase TruB [Gammaproteobacteria bacterium]
MARRRKGRPINGILLLNKPTGATSNRVLQQVKRLYQAAKAGHTGSLDPLATGLLPICFGEATKFSNYMLDADKAYQVTAKMGQKTDTSDADGTVIETRPIIHSEEEFYACLDNFRGEIEQVPSMFSALKVDGQPLYKLAREGKTIERKARPLTIHKLICLSYSASEFELEVHCSKGTYIRNLVEDIGEMLACGAHVTQLHRIKVGDFGIAQAVEFDELNDKTFDEIDPLLLPVDTAIKHLQKLQLDSDSAYYLTHGQAVQMPDAPDEGLVRLYLGADFLGLGEINSVGMVAPKRLIAS